MDAVKKKTILKKIYSCIIFRSFIRKPTKVPTDESERVIIPDVTKSKVFHTVEAN
jgi:hypothetical protein